MNNYGKLMVIQTFISQWIKNSYLHRLPIKPTLSNSLISTIKHSPLSYNSLKNIKVTGTQPFKCMKSIYNILLSLSKHSGKLMIRSLSKMYPPNIWNRFSTKEDKKTTRRSTSSPKINGKEYLHLILTWWRDLTLL